jgi:subtilisin family serine protease
MSGIRILAAVLFALTPALFSQRLPGRYIVELTEPPVAARAARQSLQAATFRARVRDQQQQVRGRLQLRQTRILDSVDTVANALIVETPDSETAALAAMPGVRRVYPVRLFKRVLDRAVILHKVTDAWSRVGLEHAGEGVKIAVIDSGIESAHPAFQDNTLTPPSGFPRANDLADLELTSGKIIVARSYVPLLPNRDPDWSARDRVGHGTALASAAAGLPAAGPLAAIAGVAPRAWLGNYKIFGTPGYNDYAGGDAILKAIDDAVSDGMDIINLSLGDDFAPRLEDDIDAQAVERAAAAGVIVVVAAGNNGPALNTLASPATAPSAIAVGATTNDRAFAASVELSGFATFVAVNGSGRTPSSNVSAPVADVAALDGDGLACSVLPAGSLAGRVALILRGTCTFETKLNIAQRAGAVAALVYASDPSTAPFTMGVGFATLPAQMISYHAGLEIKQRVSGEEPVTATLRFELGPVALPANRLADFSAAGPGVDLAIKPDLVAAGQDIYVATQSLDSRGDMFDASGFRLVDGTSFSAPLVAGAAALLKSARPGLTAAAYRSLLINTASQTVAAGAGDPPALQQTGAGLLDVDAALRSTVAAFPASLGFGAGGPDPWLSRKLTLTNIGTETETFTLSVVPRTGSAGPTLESSALELVPGASVELPVLWTGVGLAPGAHEGFIAIEGATSGTRVHVPYWYAVKSPGPARIVVLSAISSARRGSTQRDAVYVRLTDIAGVIADGAEPTVTAISGGGAFRGLSNYDSEVPGLFGLHLQLGPAPGTNVFRIEAGPTHIDLTITAQ